MIFERTENISTAGEGWQNGIMSRYNNGPLVLDRRPSGKKQHTLSTYLDIIGERGGSDNFLLKQITVNCWDAIITSPSNRSDNQVAWLK